MPRRFKRRKPQNPPDSQAPAPGPEPERPAAASEPKKAANDAGARKTPEPDEIWDSLDLDDAEEAEPERGDFYPEPLEDDE